MVVIKPSVFQGEESYQVINNIKVLQPRYIKDPRDRKILEMKVKEY